MKKSIALVLLLLLVSACSSSPRDFYHFEKLSKPEMKLIANDIAWVIKEKYGANATLEFDYPIWALSTRFSLVLETALRRQGLALVVTDKADKKNPHHYNDFQYTLDTLSDGQLYVKVTINNTFSFQRIWLRDEFDTLRPLTTTTVFKGVKHVKSTH